MDVNDSFTTGNERTGISYNHNSSLLQFAVASACKVNIYFNDITYPIRLYSPGSNFLSTPTATLATSPTLVDVTAGIWTILVYHNLASATSVSDVKF